MKNFSSGALLLIGLFGSTLWLVADIILGYLPGGIAKNGFMSDPQILAEILGGAPLWRFPASAGFGMLGMAMSVFGYLGIYVCFRKQKILSKLTVFSGIVGTVCGAVYHVICTSSEWYYVRMSESDVRYEYLSEFMSQHEIPMRLCGGLYCLFGICLFIAMIGKKTVFSRWGAIFNIMIFYPILMVIGYPGYMSLGAMIMFAGLFAMLKKSVIIQEEMQCFQTE